MGILQMVLDPSARIIDVDFQVLFDVACELERVPNALRWHLTAPLATNALRTDQIGRPSEFIDVSRSRLRARFVLRRLEAAAFFGDPRVREDRANWSVQHFWSAFCLCREAHQLKAPSFRSFFDAGRPFDFLALSREPALQSDLLKEI
jgi:hypothetical protein